MHESEHTTERVLANSIAELIAPNVHLSTVSYTAM
jgi:hypothetical protein